jgi:branched-chain amino acid transport system permease protein
MLCVILLIRPNGLFGDRPRRRFGKQAKAAVGESNSSS